MRTKIQDIVTALVVAWLTWVSHELIQIKSDVSLLKYKNFGVVSSREASKEVILSDPNIFEFLIPPKKEKKNGN